ncbi:hypothetical protein [Pseudomonas sp. OHS18]|uniref:hypothetical protein n=1 Tax=Pseudomonas sp. OHS18 TaxID=3399679 RepID=UPI003A8BE816
MKALTAIQPHLGASKNVGEADSARQEQAKKRSLRGVNEHFEPALNAAMATQVVFGDAQLSLGIGWPTLPSTR